MKTEGKKAVIETLKATTKQLGDNDGSQVRSGPYVRQK